MNKKVYLRENIEKVYSLLCKNDFDPLVIEMVVVSIYCQNYEQASRLFGIGREAMIRKIQPIRLHYKCKSSNKLYIKLETILTRSDVEIRCIPFSTQMKILICDKLFIRRDNIGLSEVIEIITKLFHRLDNKFYQAEFLIDIVKVFGNLYDER